MVACRSWYSLKTGGLGRFTRIPGHTCVNLCLPTPSLSRSCSRTHSMSFPRLVELELFTCLSLELECPPRLSMYCPCKRRLWTRNVWEVRHHAWRPQMVTVFHGRVCSQCTDICESGLELHDMGLEQVLHKIGKLMCWVRVNIIGVYIACRCSSSSLAGELFALLVDWLSGPFCMRPRSIPMLFIVA